MTRAEISEKLKEVFSVAMGPAGASLTEYDESSNLVSDMGLNSVGILYVVIAIEEFFSIQFDDVGFGDFQTVGDVITYIEGKVNQ
ncbi:MAG: hypothetical protein IKK58_02900 [Clostridia bacterium]|nr:hypothetical protein [Clostridia bacterium]